MRQTWLEVYLDWTLGLGFLVLITGIGLTAAYVTSDAYTKRKLNRQRHRQRMKEMRQRAELMAAGRDPEYVEFLRRQVEKDND